MIRVLTTLTFLCTVIGACGLMTATQVWPVIPDPAPLHETTYAQFVADIRGIAEYEHLIPVIGDYVKEDFPNCIVTWGDDWVNVEGTDTPRFSIFITDEDPEPGSHRYGAAYGSEKLAFIFGSVHRCQNDDQLALSMANTTSHEIGHLLGRSHVEDPYSYMSTENPYHWMCTVNRDGR